MKVILSVVSHGHEKHIENLLSDLDEYLINDSHDFSIVIVDNLNNISWSPTSKFNIRMIRNIRHKGYGANHNSVFELFWPDFFIIINPDVRLNSYINLNDLLIDDSSLQIASPTIINTKGEIEDFAREDLTILNLIKRKLFFIKPSNVDWFAGIFLIINKKSMLKISGFDTRFFMYVEDCDLCTRLTNSGGHLKILDFEVIHDARRDSRRKLQYLKYHLASLTKYIGGFRKYIK